MRRRSYITMGSSTKLISGSCFTKLFPTPLAFLLFASYIALSICLSIFVTRTQQSNHSYSYSVTTVVLIVEATKLLAATLFYMISGSVSTLINDCWVFRKVLVLYLVPGALYCLYNNLAFTNLSSFDPTSYYLLMQLRVLVTGIMYQLLFKKELSRIQWLALIVLTIGCVVKQMDITLKTDVQYPEKELQIMSSSLNTQINLNSHYLFSLMLVLVQIFCSCLASVYNEHLLKGHSGNAGLVLQNVFMYFDSCLCNLSILLVTGRLADIFSEDLVNKIFLNPGVMLIVVNNAALGLVTSAFLKHLNSILKVFASAIEPSILAVLCLIIFGHTITLYTVISILLVTGALVIYSINPINVPDSPPITTTPIRNLSNGSKESHNIKMDLEAGSSVETKLDSADR